jgi:bifunctional non-homologous end joining protein LigD
VLLSWAVPKGPSLDPADKRLAVHVEDHPLDYGGFEGVIPEGEYGGGTVLLWDKGTWEPQEDAHAALRKGSLKFRLAGRKLRGGWALVRLRGRAGEGDRNWLLIKERDAQARPGVDVVATRGKSVLSRRDIAGVARKHGATPRQLQSAQRAADLGKLATARPRRAAAKARPRKRSAAPALKLARRPAGSRASLPAFVPPELCTLVDAAPAGDDWLHEIKLDGYRLLARRQAGAVRLWSRNRIDWTARLPALVAALRKLPARAALLDGELVMADARGRTSFEGLKRALSEGHADRLTYAIFDLLHLDGRDLRREPLVERKRALQALLADAPRRGPLRFLPHAAGGGPAALRAACRAGLEGIICKRADAPYRSQRGGDWLKVKCVQRQELVLLGFTPPTRREFQIGSLILGVHERGRLRYAGRVGTGFDAAQRADLRRRLLRLATTRPPVEVPREPGLRGATWARPKLVAEVAFTEWTADGRLRHPSFQGLREDKAAREVVVERPRRTRAAAARSRRPAPRPAARRPAARRSRARSVALRRAEPAPTRVAGVRLTHPDKLLWPDAHVSKANLAAYLHAVARRMLPHLRDRPLTLVRCPNGVGRGCFFQKHAGEGTPDTIDIVEVPEAGGALAAYMSVRDTAGLLAMAQIGALELHVAGVRADQPRKPDRMVLDLDPAPEVPFARVMAAARELRRRLQRARLKSFVMTTGGKGLHVVVPLDRRHDIEQVSDFAESLARALEAEQPRHFIAKASKAARRGRIFVDWVRNARGATAIAPYSTRARPGAPVAVPLAWEELKAGLKPDGFSIAQVLRRITRRDPWAGYTRAHGRLPAAARR